MKKLLSALLLLIAASTAQAQSVAVGAAQATADVATGTLILRGRNAYPRATTNTTGGAIKMCPGIGRRLATIVDYSLIDDVDTITLTIDGSASVLTASVEWGHVISNTNTALSLASAINKLSGVFATASGAVVYITPLPTTCTLTIATTMTSGEGTVTSGTDGAYTVPGNAAVTGTLLVTGVATFTVSPVITTAASPTAAAACTAGTLSWDTSYLYVCTASGASKRVALTGGY